MKSHDQKDIISNMVQETKASSESSNFSVANLKENSKEFENLLKDLALTSDAYFSELNFVSQTQMFRFCLKGKVIDIPVNWLFFSDLYMGMQSGDYKLTTVGRDDEDGLVEIFSLLWPNVNEFTFITYNFKVYFVASEQGRSFAEILAQNFRFTRSKTPKAA